MRKVKAEKDPLKPLLGYLKKIADLINKGDCLIKAIEYTDSTATIKMETVALEDDIVFRVSMFRNTMEQIISIEDHVGILQETVANMTCRCEINGHAMYSFQISDVGLKMIKSIFKKATEIKESYNRESGREIFNEYFGDEEN